jgi:hypothetical protein
MPTGMLCQDTSLRQLHLAILRYTELDQPDFTPPAVLDPAATPVELVNWRLEMDTHFAYTMANKALATAILDSVGASNKAALKVAFHPRPLHFLTPIEMVTEMFRKHAALTGPPRPAKATGSPA